MSLSDFLQGMRPNPSPQGEWRLLHRHAEGGPWTVVARAGSEEGIEEECRAGPSGWGVPASPGDLVRLGSPEGGFEMLGVGDDGVLRPLEWARCPEWVEGEAWTARTPWPEVWETFPESKWLLGIAASIVPRAALARAAAACARAALATVDVPDPDAVATLDLLDAWLSGAPGVDAEAVRRRAAGADQAADELLGEGVALEEERGEAAAMPTLRAADATRVAGLAATLAVCEARFVGEVIFLLGEHCDIPDFAGVVHAALPLSELVRALAAPPGLPGRRVDAARPLD